MRRVLVVVGARFHVPDVGVDVGDLRADRGQQPLPVLDLHRQPHGVARAASRRRLVPLDVDAALGVVQQVDDVRAGRGVDRHALAARDVADDLLAADRIAAARAEHHQVVDARDLDLLFAAAEARAARRRRPALPAASRAGDPPAPASPGPASARPCRSRSPRTARRASCAPILGQRLREAPRPRAASSALRSKRRASFSNSLRPSSMLRAPSPRVWMKCLILLRARDVTTKFSQSRLGLWPGCVTISTMSPFLQPRAQRHHLAVDARADALVADVGVNRVREVDRRRAARQRLHLRPSA